MLTNLEDYKITMYPVSSVQCLIRSIINIIGDRYLLMSISDNLAVTERNKKTLIDPQGQI